MSVRSAVFAIILRRSDVVRRPEIDEQNRYLPNRQRQFRMAADIVVDAWSAFPEVHALAMIGSVAKPLWKEVPRFKEFRRARIELWHERGDLDLALWIDSQDRLGALRRAATKLDCLVPGCGQIAFNKRIVEFVPHADLLAPDCLSAGRRQGALCARFADRGKGTGDA